MTWRDGSDKRHYGKCKPLFYVGTRPFIVIGADWIFQIITLAILIFFYFGPYSEMFLHDRWPWTSWVWFQLLRIIHFVSFGIATLTNPGFATKESLMKFNRDFKIGARNEEE